MRHASSIVAVAALNCNGRADAAGPPPAASALWDQRRVGCCPKTSSTSLSAGRASAQETLRRRSVRCCVGSDCPPPRRPWKKAEGGRGDLGADVDLERTPSAPASPSAPRSRAVNPTASRPGDFHGCCATSVRTTSSSKAQSQATFSPSSVSTWPYRASSYCADSRRESHDCHLPLVSRTRYPTSSTCRIAEPPLMRHNGAWAGGREL